MRSEQDKNNTAEMGFARTKDHSVPPFPRARTVPSNLRVVAILRLERCPKAQLAHRLPPGVVSIFAHPRRRLCSRRSRRGARAFRRRRRRRSLRYLGAHFLHCLASLRGPLAYFRRSSGGTRCGRFGGRIEGGPHDCLGDLGRGFEDEAGTREIRGSRGVSDGELIQVALDVSEDGELVEEEVIEVASNAQDGALAVRMELVLFPTLRVVLRERKPERGSRVFVIVVALALAFTMEEEEE